MIKNIPKKIYLQIGEDISDVKDFGELCEVTWAADRIFKTDIVFYLKKRSSKRRRISPNKPSSNVAKRDFVRRAKRRNE